MNGSLKQFIISGLENEISGIPANRRKIFSEDGRKARTLERSIESCSRTDADYIIQPVEIRPEERFITFLALSDLFTGRYFPRAGRYSIEEFASAEESDSSHYCGDREITTPIGIYSIYDLHRYESRSLVPASLNRFHKEIDQTDIDYFNSILPVFRGLEFEAISKPFDPTRKAVDDSFRSERIERFSLSKGKVVADLYESRLVGIEYNHRSIFLGNKSND